MTGFLTLDRFRALQAPRSPWSGRAGAARSRLIAQWGLDPQGRLICRWRADKSPTPKAVGCLCSGEVS